MTDKTRTKLAAGAVALFLAAASTAGVLSHTRTPAVAVASPATSAVHGPSATAQVHSVPTEHDSGD
jgi:hypothetical protein